MKITRDVLNLRFAFKEKILRAAEQTVIDGTPVNRPLWWIDPTDQVTYTIDDRMLFCLRQSDYVRLQRFEIVYFIPVQSTCWVMTYLLPR